MAVTKAQAVKLIADRMQKDAEDALQDAEKSFKKAEKEFKFWHISYAKEKYADVLKDVCDAVGFTDELHFRCLYAAKSSQDTCEVVCSSTIMEYDADILLRFRVPAQETLRASWSARWDHVGECEAALEVDMKDKVRIDMIKEELGQLPEGAAVIAAVREFAKAVRKNG